MTNAYQPFCCVKSIISIKSEHFLQGVIYTATQFLFTHVAEPIDNTGAGVGMRVRECRRRDRCKWRKQSAGALTYVKDYSRKSYYLRLWDMEVSLSLLRSCQYYEYSTTVQLDTSCTLYTNRFLFVPSRVFPKIGSSYYCRKV